MNKQELIERIEGLKNIFGNKAEYIEIDAAIELVSKLDEPQKVTIPQFVAEYIEHKKNEDYHLLGAMAEIRSHKNKEIDEWFTDDDNMELFARAWLDGYEVEKEKLYLVKIKGVNEECEYLVFGELSNTWKLRSLGSFGELRKHHTRKELEEAGFGEIFNSPLFEVVEVE